MNHLAHLFLSPPSVEARVGNLLGDFARGLDSSLLPSEVRRGLENHRAVDAFTDQHPDVKAAKTLFSSKRRRFAGVALDVLFDHYLLRHWRVFTDTPKSAFIEDVYHDLTVGRPLMPERMARVTQRMVEDDWLGAYESLDNIGLALDRIAGRIRFRNEFAGMIEEIRPLDAALEAHFLSFFPQLVLYFPPE